MNKDEIKAKRAIIGGWPKEAYFSSGNLRMSHEEMDSSDEYRCGPVFLIDGDWAWCNDDPSGHLDKNGGPYCSYCQKKL